MNVMKSRSGSGCGSLRPLGQYGFTLIEVMVAVVIVAILAAVALPSYQEYVRKSNRVAAMSTLMQAANWMQQYQTVNQRYSTGATSGAPTLPTSLSKWPDTGTAKYNITLTNVTNATYTVQMAPNSPYTDTKCSTMTLSQTGAKGSTGTYSTADCWSGK